LTFGGVLVVLSVLYAHTYTLPLLSVMLLIIGALWIRKTVQELGWDNVRGQFYAVMGGAFLLQSVGFLLTGMSTTITLSILAAAIYLLARLLFLIGNVRYVFHFQSLGYGIGRPMTTLVAVITLLLGGTVLLLGKASSIPLYPWFIALDSAMLFIVLYNFLLLRGSDIARKWAIGYAVIFLFLVGDYLLASGHGPLYPVLLWTTSFTLMGVISLMRG